MDIMKGKVAALETELKLRTAEVENLKEEISYTLEENEGFKEAAKVEEEKANKWQTNFKNLTARYNTDLEELK